MLSITKTFEFAASHRLYREEWSDEKNASVYGKCANPNGHGHNYRLEVSVCGEVDPETGMVMDASVLDKIVREEILDHVDHKHLDKDVPWLEGQVSTTEVLVELFWSRLSGAIASKSSNAKLAKIRLWETGRIFAEKVS